ncbi:MAG: hypothetical protein ACI8P3_000244 [Saprospiraceae bacterium]|jgi:hypothetical protein
MKKKIKTIVINLMVFIVLLIIADFFLAIALDLRQFNKNRSSGNGIGRVIPNDVNINDIDKRAFLSNYDSLDWAIPYYLEENREKSAAYKSYVGFRLKPYQGVHITIDTNGFRYTPQLMNDNDSLPIAVFLGGSTMYGSGCPDNYTIPFYFARNQKGFKVFNFGQPTYTAYQSFIALQLEITKGFEPNLVISYDGVNNSPALHGFFEHSREALFKERIQGVRPADTSKDFLSFRANRKFIEILRYKIKSNEDSTIDFNKAAPKMQNEAAAIELLESWLAMKTLCKEHDADFVCFLQPHTFVGNPDLSNLINSNYTNWHRGLYNSYQYYDNVFRLLDTDKYKELKPHFYDLTNVLDHMPNVYIDFCHLSPNGNEKIADEILKYLRQERNRNLN